MGCGSSQATEANGSVPVERVNVGETDGTEVKSFSSSDMRPNPPGMNGAVGGRPDETPGGTTEPPLAFEIPATDDGGIVKKHPPKRLQRLEEMQVNNGAVLDEKTIEEKQAEAERRRKEILSKRVQSAKRRQPSFKEGKSRPGTAGTERESSAATAASTSSPA